MLRTIRITLASLTFLGITLLFLDISGFLHIYLGWLAKVQFLPAVLALNVGVILALVALTLIFGRIYCSVICPLGILQDVLARLRPSKKNKVGHYSYSPEVRWLRYPVWVLFVVALVAGIGSFVALLAPYSSYGRIVTNLLKPLYQWANNGLAALAEHYDSYAFYATDVWVRSLPTLLIAAGTLAVLAVLAWRGGRTYCNTLCPVGTTLSFFSRISLLKVNFDADKCRSCSKCSKGCKAACIDYKSHTVDYSRCVVCGNCISNCKFGALKYDVPKLHRPLSNSPRGGEDSFSSEEEKDNIGLAVLPPTGGAGSGASRRAFLQSSLLLASTAALAQVKTKTDGGLAEIEDKVAPERKTPLTPPGSLSAKHFAQHCTGCQLCVSQCPNDVLRPSTGLLTLMQPVMSYERGYCRPECNRCSEVCPTGAIRPITKEEKASTQIGHAVWIKKNCVVLTDDVRCGNCARHCPSGAIQMVPSDPDDEHSHRIPVINEAKCIGCGACEQLCPARPFSAIYVEGHEVQRTV
ncbi:MAG: 4Fe-4S binding protein [Bacteroidaceae bacterium]|nr:4Fe-4S binding protein [Bacteroidaceae bacterium]